MHSSVRHNKFEALKIQFLDQSERLYRMTMIDLKIFTGYITLQVVMGGWIIKYKYEITDLPVQIGIMITDLGFAIVAIALLINNYIRRKEVSKTIRNCSEALGYDENGAYLEGRKLYYRDEKKKDKEDTHFWLGWYLLGIVLSLTGVMVITFSYQLRFWVFWF